MKEESTTRSQLRKGDRPWESRLWESHQAMNKNLGIPTVLDRVIQQAIAQVLGDLHDPTFSEHSYGFRPGRSAHQAIEAMRGMSLRKGYGGRRCHVVDCDLETFFDTINHQKNDLQRYLRGAVNYDACGIPYREIVELDQ